MNQASKVLSIEQQHTFIIISNRDETSSDAGTGASGNGTCNENDVDLDEDKLLQIKTVLEMPVVSNISPL